MQELGVFLVACSMGERYTVHDFNGLRIRESTELMPSRHRLEKKPPHNIDIAGIAVALAFLVGVGLFAGDQNDHSASEGRPSSTASLQIAPALTMEKTQSLQDPNDDPELSDTSGELKAFR